MSSEINSAPIAITCGDPAGIGPEIISTWLRENPAERANVAVIGPTSCIQDLDTSVRTIPVGLEIYAAIPGLPDGEGSLVAWAAIERAAAGAVAGEFSAVVTGPVSKERMAAIGFPFPGQTEFFAARWGGNPVMTFAGGRLRVALATWHLPLRDVPAALTASVLHRAICAADELARADGIHSPQIGVCGLNPHAGEAGLLGMEERDTLNPALEAIRRTMPGVSLCQPGDTIFARALRGEFDAVVALFHDQGLAPLKTLEFDEAVNITLGLPYIRTSPDHGTAFPIAGKRTANARSFSNAMAVARRLIKFRAGR